MYKVDLHTHSVASPDGGINAAQYRKILDTKKLDYIAVTDHDRIDFALQLQAELGDHIIVGEEITSSEGEIIGLFLTKRVKPGMSAAQTTQAIHDQGGLVYIPHPFETVRKGLTLNALNSITDTVDIIEVKNGRAFFQNFSSQAADWASTHHKPGAASSDAHGVRGLGFSYSSVNSTPSHSSLVTLLPNAPLTHRRAPLYTLLYPKLNRVRKSVGNKK